jgi:hypothetical protein
MDSQNILFIYSNKTSLCNMLISKIINYNLNFITPICIDKLEVRKRIMKNNPLIKYVPTIIINKEILEGDKSVLFIESLVKKIEEKNKPPVEIENPTQSNRNVNPKEYNTQRPRESQRSRESQLPRETQRFENKELQATSIDDVLSEDENDDFYEDEPIEKNVKKIQNSRMKRDTKSIPENQLSSYTQENITKSLNDKVNINELAKKMEEERKMDIGKRPPIPN